MGDQRDSDADRRATGFEFDVAVSFLRRDLDLAHEIRDRLEPQLHVFVYDREQETVAASDGLDDMDAALF